ncbi:MAG: Rpn family recombination-promoting nuclease/putative transposase, partial [Planctomycetaceae bacterium]|nr:Rpn family recombination-promoting nuclease/putative transposase [Planctomycetaceae bacterium]
TDIGKPKIITATVLNPFNIQEFAADKQIRLDVRVQDETQAQYIVEVQTADHASFTERMLFYWAETHSSQLKRGDKYQRLRPTRSIVITEFPFRSGELSALHAVFDIRERSQPSVQLTEHFEMHVLRLGDLPTDTLCGLEQLCLPLRDWMHFWRFGLEMKENKMSVVFSDPAVQAAYEEFQRFSGDPVMREKVRARERFLEEQNIILAETKAESEARGELKRSAEIARTMKAKGYALTTITELTGLSSAEIERL